MLTRFNKHGSMKESDTAKSSDCPRNHYCHNENNTDLNIYADTVVTSINGNVTFCENSTTVLLSNSCHCTEDGSSKSVEAMKRVTNECVGNGNVKFCAPVRVQDEAYGDESWNIKSSGSLMSSEQTPIVLETTFGALGSNPTLETSLIHSNCPEFSRDQNDTLRNNNTSNDCNSSLSFIPANSETDIVNSNSVCLTENIILNADSVLEANPRSFHNHELLFPNFNDNSSSHLRQSGESLKPAENCTSENCSEQSELLEGRDRHVMDQTVAEYPVTEIAVSTLIPISTPSQSTSATTSFLSSFNTSTGTAEYLTNGERVEYIQADSSISDVFHEQSLDGTGGMSTYGLDTYASIPKASSGGRLRGSVELILEQATESLGIESLSSAEVSCNSHNDVRLMSSSDDGPPPSTGDDRSHGDDTRETAQSDSSLLDNDDGEFQPPPLPVRNYTLSPAGDYEDDSGPSETMPDPVTASKEVWVLKNKTSAPNECSDRMAGTFSTPSCCDVASCPGAESEEKMPSINSFQTGPSIVSRSSLVSSPINPRISTSTNVLSETPKTAATTLSNSCQSSKYEFPKQRADVDITLELHDERVVSQDFGSRDSQDGEAQMISSRLESPTVTTLDSTPSMIAAGHRTLPAVPKTDHAITRSKSVNVSRGSSLRRRFSFTNPFERKSKRRPCNSAYLQEDHNMTVDERSTGNQSILNHSTLESADTEVREPPSQESAVQFSPLPVVERRVDRGVFRNPFARKDKHKSFDEASYHAASNDCQRPVSSAPRVSNCEDSHDRSATLDSRVANSIQSPSTSSHSETLLEKFAVSCRSFKLRFMDNAGRRRREAQRYSMLEAASAREVESGSTATVERNVERENSNVDAGAESIRTSESSILPAEVRPPCVPPRDTRNRCSANIVRPRSALTPNHSVRSSAAVSNMFVGADGLFTGAETSESPVLPPPVACSSGGQNMEFIQSLCDLKECGWYWGPLGWEEAELRLADQADGTFLVRDSSDEHYILSLSFRSQGTTHHTRIEHYRGQFSFYSQPKSHGASTIVDFIDRAMEHSRNGKFLYFLRPRGAGHPPTPVQMLYPLSRFARVQSLQHSCRFVILKSVRRDHIAKLPLPGRIQQYLMEAQYYTEYCGTEE